MERVLIGMRCPRNFHLSRFCCSRSSISTRDLSSESSPSQSRGGLPRFHSQILPSSKGGFVRVEGDEFWHMTKAGLPHGLSCCPDNGEFQFLKNLLKPTMFLDQPVRNRHSTLGQILHKASTFVYSSTMEGSSRAEPP